MSPTTSERVDTPTRGLPVPPPAPGPEGAGQARGTSIFRRLKQQFGIYLFMAPAVLYLCIFTVYSLVQGVMLSFTATRLVNPDGGRPVGLENFEYLVGSSAFWDSVLTTVLYTFFTVIFVLVLGVGAALALDTKFFGRSVVRAIATIPWAIPTIAATLIFAWIYNNQQGIAGKATGALGLGQPGWLTDPNWGLFSVTVATVWKAFPLVMLVMLAALQSVPHTLKEASWIDGAGAWQTFKAVTLPHIAPTIRVMTLLMTIWSIRRFEIIYVMTGGGPIDATNTLVVNIYNTAFADQHLGRAAAIGVLGLGLSLTVTVAYFLMERRREKKGED